MIQFPIQSPILFFDSDPFTFMSGDRIERYLARYTESDFTNILISSDFPVNISSVLLEYDNKYVKDIQFEEFINEGVYYYLSEMDFSELSGMYKIELNTDDKVFYSQPICVRTGNNQYRLIEYYNRDEDDGIIWGTIKKFAIRVEGCFFPTGLAPKSVNTVFRDQKFKMQLYGKGYCSKVLTIGPYGIPNDVMLILNSAFSCEYLFIDKLGYVKPDESTDMEPYEDVAGTEFRRWQIELEPSKRKLYTKVIQNIVSGNNNLISGNNNLVKLIQEWND